MFYALKALLPKVVDMDLVLSQLAARPHVGAPAALRGAVPFGCGERPPRRGVRVWATRSQGQ